MNTPEQQRPIRSYVLRAGRMTAGQQRAVAEHWQRWGLEHADGRLDSAKLFARSAPLVLEIGFGMGHSLVEMAAKAPEKNFIGVEVHGPGVGTLLQAVAAREIDNIRVYRHDAVEVLRDCIAPASLACVQIFFPDPWHKKRHHKRRLIQRPFLDLVASRIEPGGTLHLATDWEDYARQMLELLGESPDFANTCADGGYAPRPELRPPTKFEQRGERLGHGVWDLVFMRC